MVESGQLVEWTIWTSFSCEPTDFQSGPDNTECGWTGYFKKFCFFASLFNFERLFGNHIYLEAAIMILDFFSAVAVFDNESRENPPLESSSPPKPPKALGVPGPPESIELLNKELYVYENFKSQFFIV